MCRIPAKHMAMVCGLISVWWSAPAWGQDVRPAWAAPPLRDAVSVRDGRTGERIAFDAFLDELAQADAVFLGESHDDETTHRFQLAVYEALLVRKPQRVVLAMEMFERDVQTVLDDYLARRIDETEFLSRSRPWGNYRTAYRPLIERAKQAEGLVIAANFPRPLRTQVAAQGAAALESLTPEQAAQVPREYHPNTDAYWRRVDNAVRGHSAMMRGGGTDAQSRVYAVQSLWDNAMGEACADVVAKYPGHTVLHINGGFHSAYWDGTVHQFRLRQPEARVRTVAIIPATSHASAEMRGAPVADFVAFVDAVATDVRDESYAVVGQQQLKYRLHVPAQASPERPVPLMIVLVDDGFTSQDGLDLWRERLGEEAAVVVMDPPYRELQEDLAVGGRWFWPDSFADDVGRVVAAVENVWAYVARYFPIDPARVCVIGEGTGGTVAAASALMADRMSVCGVAVAPRQYAKLQDFPLPLPELFGDAGPPQRSVRGLVTADDVAWWEQELRQYGAIGVTSEIVLRTDDPWESERQVEQVVRTALGCTPLPPAAEGPRRFIHLTLDAPRARQWARLQALRLAGRDEAVVAVASQPPASPAATAISTTVGPQMLTATGALPRCPGPFGGTTVLVLPPDLDAPTVAAWKNLADNDPLAKESRFHRVRLAMPDGPGHLHDVLVQLEGEGRKNILVVPAEFYAPGERMRILRHSVRDLDNQLTLHWLPGLGGQPLALEIPPELANHVPLRHVLAVTLLPADGRIAVRDRLELPAALCDAGTEFTLDANLQVTFSQPAVERLEARDPAGLARYRISQGLPDGVLEIAYEGPMDYGLSDQQEEYTRGFRQTRGIVSQEGVYLDGDSGWVPRFDDNLIRFTMELELPTEWHVISAGDGSSQDGQGAARWDSQGLVEQIYLVGGPLIRYVDAAGAVEALVYLRTTDDSLARKYLDATAQYIEMYRELIGPYPYGKFALVENFWETGYGMPSFTLLGSQVIRFPFILHSSYPHEILHNWWGNSVFVDPAQGNWCEGLTAYLADHLVQEQRELGHEYRRSTLQKYRNYVQDARDFPLSEFRQRHSAATEAVGYGKALMMNHMLRRQIGDDAFRAGLAAFYRKYRGQRASFEDLRSAFESAGSTDLGPFFEQWTRRVGAPVLSVTDVRVEAGEKEYAVSGVLHQTQEADPYWLQVPVSVHTLDGTHTSVVTLGAREEAFSLTVDAAPLSLHVDPMFDLFRLLDPRETPASIGQIFGEPRILAVLPAAASDVERSAYRELVETWQSDSHTVDVVLDSDLPAIPEEVSAWVLGRGNRFAVELFGRGEADPAAGDAAGLPMGDQLVPYADHSLVVVRRHPNNVRKAIGLVTVDPLAAVAGLARKLPHYGKYSYLAFEGDEPTNVVKGQGDAAGSPLVMDLREKPGNALPLLEPEKRRALAELPPVFSARKLMEHVEWLAAPEREGRGLGSAGLQQSAEYIARQMAEIGLQPGGDEGTWFQKFTVEEGPDGTPVETVNVIGVLPGKQSEWASQSIVVGAHYDHLGFGWPDVREGFQGQLHPGADDNASGIAVMLELARNLVAGGDFGRNLVCVAFSAEECGRHGSRHYATQPRFPRSDIRGVVNFDTVGRLFDGKIAIHAAGTADQWQHIFRGCGFVTGVPYQIVMESGEASDQMSFIEQGIPAVQIFTGAHADYHRPSDTVDKIDAAGLVKVATFAKEAITYLLDREPPLSVRISAPAGNAVPVASPSGSGRQVLFGTVPAFDYQGEGVQVESLVADSPAAQAGLEPGDVITQVDDRKIADLREFSQVLKELQPHQTVTVVIVRDGVNRTLSVTVVPR